MMTHFSTKDHFPLESRVGGNLDQVRDNCLGNRHLVFLQRRKTSEQCMQIFKHFSDPVIIKDNSQRQQKKTREANRYTNQIIDSVIFQSVQPNVSPPMRMGGFGNDARTDSLNQRINIMTAQLGINNRLVAIPALVEGDALTIPVNQLRPNQQANPAQRENRDEMIGTFLVRRNEPSSANLVGTNIQSSSLSDPSQGNNNEEDEWISEDEEENQTANVANNTQVPAEVTPQGFLDSDAFQNFFAQTRNRMENHHSSSEDSDDVEDSDNEDAEFQEDY